MKAKVSIIKTSPKKIINDYSKVMNLADYKKHLKKDNDLLLKLNLSWSLYFPACSTQPWQLDGVLNTLRKDQFKNIIPVEHRTVVTDVQKGIVGNKWDKVLQKHDLNLTPLADVEWIDFKPKASLQAIPILFPDGHKIPKMFLNKNVCHLPTLKCHGHTTMTGAMKNAFGGLITERRHHCHKMIHEVLVDLLKIQKEIHPNLFAVMDGTVAGNGKGPRTMFPVAANLLLASHDQVAIDAVAAKIMGFDPLQIPFIKMAHDQGLGMGDVKQIDIIGENISDINLNFTTSKSPVIFFDQLLRKSFVEPLLFRTGLFKACVMGSAGYHDKVWYPIIGKRRIRKFNKTEWGKLFKSY
jgi:uncharacterized protein (DUF362 family)